MRIGFKPFDYTQAGVQGSDQWRKLASARTYPEVQFAPEPPPLPPLEFLQDFEVSATGSGPADAHLNVEGKGDSIGVTGEIAASGKRSLKITDAPGLKNRFDPHFYFSPGHRQGVTKCAFDIRVEEGAEFYHEWRDDSSPYRVGPSLWIAGGKLSVGGKPLAEVPTEPVAPHRDPRRAGRPIERHLGSDRHRSWQAAAVVCGAAVRSAVEEARLARLCQQCRSQDRILPGQRVTGEQALTGTLNNQIPAYRRQNGLQSGTQHEQPNLTPRGPAGFFHHRRRIRSRAGPAPGRELQSRLEVCQGGPSRRRGGGLQRRGLAAGAPAARLGHQRSLRAAGRSAHRQAPVARRGLVSQVVHACLPPMPASACISTSTA